MSTLSNEGRTYSRQGINDGIEAGTTVANPYIEFRDGATVIGTITLQTDAFGTITNGVCNVNPPQGETDWLGSGSGYEITTVSAGTIDAVVYVNRDNVDIETGTVGVGSGEWQFSSLTVALGETIRITATPTASHAAS